MKWHNPTDTPPLEPGIHNLGVSADRAELTAVDVAVDDSPKGLQSLPVGLYAPRIKRLPDDIVFLRGFAWSAANAAAYQRARTQYWADAVGMNTIAPNTVGQGLDSPHPNKRQRQQLWQGSASDVAKVMVEAAISAYTKKFHKLGSVALFGESQFPALMPWVIEHLPEDIELSHVIIYNPAGTKRVRPYWTIGPQLHSVSRNFDIYRSRNPQKLRELGQVGDTNLVQSYSRQPLEHAVFYPRLIAMGGLAYQLQNSLRKTGRRPEIHIVSSEHDLHPVSANIEAARILGARHTIKRKHDHSYTEYVPAVAKELADILK